MRSAEKYDAKEAYNKRLSSKARMHYLENDIADHKGSPARMEGGRKDHKMSNSEYAAHLESPRGKKEHGAGMSRQASPLNDFKGGYHKVQHAKGEAHKSPAKNITYGDKSGPTGYIGEERKDLMKYNPVDDKVGMSRYKSDAQRKAVHASKADGGMSRQKYGGNKGDERRSAAKDYDSPASIRKSNSSKKDYDGMSRYGGNKGDIKRSAKKDY
jgi:hypothetical protein